MKINAPHWEAEGLWLSSALCLCLCLCLCLSLSLSRRPQRLEQNADTSERSSGTRHVLLTFRHDRSRVPRAVSTNLWWGDYLRVYLFNARRAARRSQWTHLNTYKRSLQRNRQRFLLQSACSPPHISPHSARQVQLSQRRSRAAFKWQHRKSCTLNPAPKHPSVTWSWGITIMSIITLITCERGCRTRAKEAENQCDMKKSSSRGLLTRQNALNIFLHSCFCYHFFTKMHCHHFSGSKRSAVSQIHTLKPAVTPRRLNAHIDLSWPMTILNIMDGVIYVTNTYTLLRTYTPARVAQTRQLLSLVQE